MNRQKQTDKPVSWWRGLNWFEKNMLLLFVTAPLSRFIFLIWRRSEDWNMAQYSICIAVGSLAVLSLVISREMRRKQIIREMILRDTPSTPPTRMQNDL